MNRHTGAPFSDMDHLAQSIADILTTPIGSRVMRRDYGSLLPDLIDSPLNSVGVLMVYAASAAALRRWEPRLRLARFALDVDRETIGQAQLTITADIQSSAASNERVTLTVPLRGSIEAPIPTEPLVN